MGISREPEVFIFSFDQRRECGDPHLLFVKERLRDSETLLSSTDARSSLASVGGALLTLPAERLDTLCALHNVSTVFNRLGDTDRTENYFTGLS